MNLETDENIVKLRNTLTNAKMSAMMTLPKDYDFPASKYKEMAADPRTPKTDALASWWAASGSCEDFVVPADMGDISGKSIKGVSSFAKYLAQDFGTNPNPVISAPGCAQQVVCNPTLSAAVIPACVAANEFMKLKNDLRSAKTFKCALFTDAAGAKCDNKVMSLISHFAPAASVN